MDRYILIECALSDKEELQQLQKIGGDVDFVDRSNLQGANDIVEAIVKLSAAITPILALFLTKRGSSERKITIDGEKKTFENYSSKEVERILEKLNDDNEEK